VARLSSKQCDKAKQAIKSNHIEASMLWHSRPSVILNKNTCFIYRTYTGGMYYFDAILESWDGIGISVTNTTMITTAAKTNHLTSFSTGFFPEPNIIDFEFVFANDSFSDNSTIFMLLIITMIFYLIGMIWATVKDMKDDKAVSSNAFKNSLSRTRFQELAFENSLSRTHFQELALEN
jgi:hypothetical protein